MNLNHAEGLAETQRSIGVQPPGPDFEWIVVDGGSSDESLTVLTTGFMPHLTVSEPDNGIYAAMNKGMRLARGRWIMYLNSGDALADPGALGRITSASLRARVWAYGARLHGGIIDRFDPYDLKAHALGRYVVPHQAVVMELPFLREIEGFREDFGLAADQEMLFRAGLRATPSVFNDVWIVQEPGGVSQYRSPGDHIRDMRAARQLNAYAAHSPSVDLLLDQVFAARVRLRPGRLRRFLPKSKR